VTSYWVIQSKGNAQLIAWIAIVGAIAYFFSVYYLGAHYSYNGATLALFALLAPVPIWFFWLEHHVGHSFLEYLAWIMLAAFIGLVVSYLMLKLNAMINNGLLAILTDGMIVVGIPVLVAWLFFRKNALSSIHLYG
jgi:O-antigen/teichoic acid export membrane protein